MKTTLLVLQIISAVLFTLLVISQQRGSGLSGAAFGTFHSSVYATKRGAEKVIANLTVIFAIAFVVLSFAASII